MIVPLPFFMDLKLTQCYKIIDLCLMLAGRLTVTLLCLGSGMCIGLHHGPDVCDCVCVLVRWFLMFFKNVSMDTCGLIQIK